MALDAGALHDSRLSVTDNALPSHFGELMDRLPPLAQTQTPQRLTLELIPRASVGSPGKRVVAVLTHLNACATYLAQLLADVVQERGRDADRHGARRGRDRFIDQ